MNEICTFKKMSDACWKWWPKGSCSQLMEAKGNRRNNEQTVNYPKEKRTFLIIKEKITCSVWYYSVMTE
jgi:hypothetical protein